MSLHASLDLSSPMTSQSGALFAPVVAQNVGVDTGLGLGGRNTHSVATTLQHGSARKTGTRKHSKKPRHKKTKHSKRKTMNRTRKNHVSKRHSKKHKKSHTKKHRKRVNQVGGGSSYEQVLAHIPGMGPRGMHTDVQAVNTGTI